MEGNLYCREDVQLENSRGHTLQCSHYHRDNDEETGNQQEPSPCVVYLHGNCGSRVDADEVVEGLLDRGLAVFSLDFAGCGLSDGDFVSLGFHEQNDLIAALKYLHQVCLVADHPPLPFCAFPLFLAIVPDPHKLLVAGSHDNKRRRLGAKHGVCGRFDGRRKLEV
eukprot:3935816-Rhodomonas_salina.1